MLMLSTNNY